MPGPALTAVVPTLDEAGNLEACLASLAWLDHVVVIDSGSRDGTVKLAAAHGATVIEQPFLGYGAQRNRAVAAAPTDWVLCVDADERVTPELGAEIEAKLGEPQERRPAGYRIPRHTWVGGHRIRYCGWQTERVLRLYDRRRGRWNDRLVHEGVELDGPAGELAAPLHHFTTPDFASFASKSRRYAELGARELLRQGRRRPSAIAVGLSPLVRFVKMYLLRRGFLDGIPGLMVCATAAYGVLLKYAFLWELTGSTDTDTSDKPLGDNEWP